MKTAEKIVDELFWTAVWVFGALIAGFFVLNVLNKQPFGQPYVGDYASWIASHADNQAYGG